MYIEREKQGGTEKEIEIERDKYIIPRPVASAGAGASDTMCHTRRRTAPTRATMVAGRRFVHNPCWYYLPPMLPFRIRSVRSALSLRSSSPEARSVVSVLREPFRCPRSE